MRVKFIQDYRLFKKYVYSDHNVKYNSLLTRRIHLKTKSNLFAAVALGLAMMAPVVAQADIATTLAIHAAKSYAEKAIQDPVMQSQIIEKIKNDPGLKDRVVAGIKNVIADPKYAAHREKAIAFLSNVEQQK